MYPVHLRYKYRWHVDAHKTLTDLVRHVIYQRCHCCKFPTPQINPIYSPPIEWFPLSNVKWLFEVEPWWYQTIRRPFFAIFCVIELIMCHSLNSIGQQTYILGHKSSIHVTVETKSQACQPESWLERDQTIDFRANPISPQPAALRTEITLMGTMQQAFKC